MFNNDFDGYAINQLSLVTGTGKLAFSASENDVLFSRFLASKKIKTQEKHSGQISLKARYHNPDIVSNSASENYSLCKGRW